MENKRSVDEEPELNEEEVAVTEEALAQSIKELVADSKKSFLNQKLSNHSATLHEYARQERAITKNYGVEKTDD